MHFTKDYSASPAPMFDALQDLKDWIGEDRWDGFYAAASAVDNAFDLKLQLAIFAGVEGKPVEALWEAIHGQGTWEEAYSRGLQAACNRAYLRGFQGRDKSDGPLVLYGTAEQQRAYQQGRSGEDFNFAVCREP